MRHDRELKGHIINPADWEEILRGPGYTWEPFGGGATEAELAALEKWFGRPLPEDYAAFLRLCNGASVEYKDVWQLFVYSTSEAPEAARGYGVTPPQLVEGVLFGVYLDDRGLVFDIRPEHPDGHYPISSLDWLEISDGWKAATRVADDFQSLLTRREPLHGWHVFNRMGLSTAACIAAPLLCPYCQATVSSVTYLKWGYCPEPSAIPPEVYQLGEPLTWKRCADGSIRPWAFFSGGDSPRTINLGDPAVEDLITRDVLQFDINPRAHARPCPACGHALEGAAVEIRDGRIRRTWIYLPGELDNTAVDYLIQPDGTLQPRPDWNNHPLETVEQC